MTPRFDWTDEKIATLKKLWEEGKTALEIATTLGIVSRNSILGKVHRLGLSGRVIERIPVERKHPFVVRKPSKGSGYPVSGSAAQSVAKRIVHTAEKLSEPQPIEPAFVPVDRIMIMIEDLRSTSCRWPHGDRAPYFYCGVDTGDICEPYCKAHHSLAYSALATRNAKARSGAHRRSDMPRP